MVQDGHCWFVSRDTPMRRCIGRLDGAVNLTILLRGESFVVGFDYFFALFHVAGRKKNPRKIFGFIIFRSDNAPCCRKFQTSGKLDDNHSSYANEIVLKTSRRVVFKFCGLVINSIENVNILFDSSLSRLQLIFWVQSYKTKRSAVNWFYLTAGVRGSAAVTWRLAAICGRTLQPIKLVLKEIR